jgi:four helix bundle protein
MAEKSQSFRDVTVWQKAHAFTLALYRVTDAFPRHELYALTSQLRRAAASVPSNFVEGFRKRTKPDKLRFYNTAQASADECLYQLILAHGLGYVDTGKLQGDLEEVSRLLQGYINGMEPGSQ